jgi:hypothetical protein
LHEQDPDNVERPAPPVRYDAIDVLRLPDTRVWYRTLDEKDKALCREHIGAIREASNAFISCSSLASGDMSRTQKHIDDVVRYLFVFISFSA